MEQYDAARDELKELKDLQGRVVAALIAMSNGDARGAETVLDGADPGEVIKLLLRFGAGLGLRVLGREGLAAALTEWLDRVAKVETFAELMLGVQENPAIGGTDEHH